MKHLSLFIILVLSTNSAYSKKLTLKEIAKIKTDKIWTTSYVYKPFFTNKSNSKTFVVVDGVLNSYNFNSDTLTHYIGEKDVLIIRSICEHPKDNVFLLGAFEKANGSWTSQFILYNYEKKSVVKKQQTNFFNWCQFTESGDNVYLPGVDKVIRTSYPGFIINYEYEFKTGYKYDTKGMFLHPKENGMFVELQDLFYFSFDTEKVVKLPNTNYKQVLGFNANTDELFITGPGTLDIRKLSDLKYSKRLGLTRGAHYSTATSIVNAKITKDSNFVLFAGSFNNFFRIQNLLNTEVNFNKSDFKNDVHYFNFDNKEEKLYVYSKPFIYIYSVEIK